MLKPKDEKIRRPAAESGPFCSPGDMVAVVLIMRLVFSTSSVINQELLDDVFNEAEFCFGRASRYLYKSKIRYKGEKQVFTDEAHFLNLPCRVPQSQGQSRRRSGSALRPHTVYSTMDLHTKWDGRQRNAEVTFCRSAEHWCLIWKDSQWQFAHISCRQAITPWLCGAKYGRSFKGTLAAKVPEWADFCWRHEATWHKLNPLADYIYWSLVLERYHIFCVTSVAILVSKCRSAAT